MITSYDGVLARLLIGAGQLDEARDRIDVGLALADETGMHFYDAELLRIRAHTHTDPDDASARSACRHRAGPQQGAHIFELRAAADDFELRGEPARQCARRRAEPVPRGQHLAGTGPRPGAARVRRPEAESPSSAAAWRG